VIITDTGRVEQRTLELTATPSDLVVAELRARLNALAIGQRLPQLIGLLDTLPQAFEPDVRPLVRSVTEIVEETLAQESEERIVLAGTANLARGTSDFTHNLGPVLEALEEQVVLLKLLGEASTADAVTVRIGQENPYKELQATSVVASGYGSQVDTFATLGVLGPTRMDYPSTMASVRAVARYVGRFLSEG